MTSLHPAITRAAMLYDEPRDMEPHEQAFLTAVHQITMTHARACGDVRRYWGDGTPAFAASKYLIDCRQVEALDYANEQYEAAIEAQDAELEYLLGVVDAEMILDAAE